MDRTEFSRWAMALKTYFPRDNLLPSQEAMELWYQELKDISFSVGAAMLRKWVDTQKWPPSISEIRTMCAELANGKLPEWSEGWAEVVRAIEKHGSMFPKEALDSMSPITRDAVEKIGWTAICMSENADVIRAQFRQVYQICLNRQVEDRQITPALKQTIRDLLPDNGLLQLKGETEK